MPSKRTTIPRACQQCGSHFLARADMVRIGLGLFCSKRCSAVSRTTDGGVVVMNDGTARIPLRTRGGATRAYAVIDVADAIWANRWQWSLNEGYAHRAEEIDGKRRKIYLHRELLGLKRGDRLEGDHIDRDRLNCRRGNLRAIPKTGNRQNRPGRAGVSSLHRGVHWDKDRQKWTAEVTVNGKHHFLGQYNSESDAAKAALSGRKRLLPYAVD